MAILTNVQIDNLCKRAAGLPHTWGYLNPDVSVILDPFLIDIFLNLYNTGLRFHEIQTSTNWAHYSETQLICTTLKGSNPRIFANRLLSDYFIQSITSESAPYQMCRYSTANRMLAKALFPFNTNFNNAGIGTHIFRHNLLKSLSDGGASVAEIAAELGEVSFTNITNYINSDIYS